MSPKLVIIATNFNHESLTGVINFNGNEIFKINKCNLGGIYSFFSF